VTNGLNAVADGLRFPLEFALSTRVAAMSPPEETAAPPGAQEVFADIKAFYAVGHVPAVFRHMSRDPVFLQGYWGATRAAFGDGVLARPLKEVLALAASFSAKSDYGIDFHMREARRLGVTEQGIMEAIDVVQCFSTVTKIADALQLQPDFDTRT
jgi:AhpD family alkylhydroperoxidase